MQRQTISCSQTLEEWTFSPEHGNVVFCSALDGWGFGLGDFARLWAKKVGCKPRELRRMLWGSFVLNAKTRKVRLPARLRAGLAACQPSVPSPWGCMTG